MRLFLAIFPQKEFIGLLESAQNRLKQYDNFIRFTKPSQMHVTLRFFGNFVTDSDFERLSNILSISLKQHNCFNLKVESFKYGFFQEKWPRILYLSILKCCELEKLMSEVNHLIDKEKLRSLCEYRRGDQNYHITIGRTKARLNKEIVHKIRKEICKFEVLECFMVEKISIVESKLSSFGPKYVILKDFYLQKNF